MNHVIRIASLPQSAPTNPWLVYCHRCSFSSRSASYCEILRYFIICYVFWSRIAFELSGPQTLFCDADAAAAAAAADKSKQHYEADVAQTIRSRRALMAHMSRSSWCSQRLLGSSFNVLDCRKLPCFPWRNASVKIPLASFPVTGCLERSRPEMEKSRI